MKALKAGISVCCDHTVSSGQAAGGGAQGSGPVYGQGVMGHRGGAPSSHWGAGTRSDRQGLFLREPPGLGLRAQVVPFLGNSRRKLPGLEDESTQGVKVPSHIQCYERAVRVGEGRVGRSPARAGGGKA